jgi:hypothetical protein
MVTSPHQDTLSTLASLDATALRALHQRGSCPDVDQLRGKAAGRILLPAASDRARLWRGKVFDWRAGCCGGLNRLGIGPLTFSRYRFEARVAMSAFGDRRVVLLDHDLAGNPAWVRRFHDELVAVSPGLYLATSHRRRNGASLHFAAYFALDFRPDRAW